MLDAVKDLVRLSYEVFSPPSIWPLAVDCKPEKMVEGEVRVKFRVLTGVARPVTVGESTVILFVFLLRWESGICS